MELDAVLKRLWTHEPLCTNHTCQTREEEGPLLFQGAAIPSPASALACPGCHLATHITCQFPCTMGYSLLTTTMGNGGQGWAQLFHNERLSPPVLGAAIEECSLEGHHEDSQHSSSDSRFSLSGVEQEETLITGCICKEDSICQEVALTCYSVNVCGSIWRYLGLDEVMSGGIRDIISRERDTRAISLHTQAPGKAM